MKPAYCDLPELLASLHPDAVRAERHLWLINLCAWVRGDARSVHDSLARLRLFCDAMDADPVLRERLQAWWRQMADGLDITTLLADFGFAPRTAFFSEFAERLRFKMMPRSPDTIDASELFSQALPTDFDAQWLVALDLATARRLLALLLGADEEQARVRWQQVLLDAMAYCAGQMLATGFAPELRVRMSAEQRKAQPFHALLREIETLRVEVLHPLRTSDRLDAAVHQLRERLDTCRSAINSIYLHFEDNGISVGLVFRLRQMRTRILRVRALLDCLLSETPAQDTLRLLSQLVRVGRERHSVSALLATNSSLLAAKVAERNAETGEHYITRTRREYLHMLTMASGGGLVMAFTTLLKFGLYALGLTAFWGGLAAGLNYAISFVLIQWLHFTVATKQPAMTAPAMAAKLKNLADDQAVQEFVDVVGHLVRSQVAAVLGTVLRVLPAAMLLSWLLARWMGHPVLDEAHARSTLASLSLWGPSLFFAAFTGVLLFASSILAGWVENWFVLHRLDSAIQYNPRITRWLGKARAARWGQSLRANISGYAANISLGLMLGLAPAFAAFFGLGLEVRHVTLSTGQIGVAAISMGSAVLHEPLLWWALAMVPFNGAINVGVSFYLAFRVALRAHNVTRVERARIYLALLQRLRQQPLSFFVPPRTAQAGAGAGAH